MSVISTPKDFINAASRAVRLQGDKWDAVTIISAMVEAGAVVASRKARLFGKTKKLVQLVQRGDSAGPVARRLAKEVVQKLDDIPGAASLDNLAQIAAEGSDEARLALKALMDGAGTKGVGLDLIEGMVANSDDAEGMIKALGKAQSRLPREEFLDILSIGGSCALRSATQVAVRVASLSLSFLMAAAAGPACPRWTPKALEGFADYTEIVRTTQVARGRTAKGMQEAMAKHLAARGKLSDVLEKVNHFATKSPRPDGFADVLLDMGRANANTSRGAERVLEMGFALVNPAVPGRTLRRFELPQQIPALRTAKGNVRSRRYDVVLDEAVGGVTKQVNVEVKAWDIFPPFKAGQLEGALDQMRRDFVLQVTSGGDLSQIRWLFPDVPGPSQSSLLKHFADSLDTPSLRSALKAQGIQDSAVSGLVA